MKNGRLRLYEHLKKKHERDEKNEIRKQCLEEELEIIKNTKLDYLGMGDEDSTGKTFLKTYTYGEEFSEKLINKPEIIIANKMDLESSKENLKEFKKKITDKTIYEVSALNNEGLEDVIEALGELVINAKDEVLFDEKVQEKHVLYKFKKEKPFNISKDGNVFVISGKEVERIFKMINFNTEESFMRFSKKLRHMGIDDELEKMNIQEGDIVRILDYEFEYTK